MVGFAVTMLPVVALNPAPGLQEYVEPPKALSVAVPPLQILVSFPALATGLVFTVTTAVVVTEPAHKPPVSVIV